MADIDVVPKRRSSTWVWILAAIVIIAVIAWAVMGRRDASPAGALRPATAGPSAGVASTLPILNT